MTLSAEDLKQVTDAIDDAMATAGEQFSQQARNAAATAIENKLPEVLAQAQKAIEGVKPLDEAALEARINERIAAEMARRDETAAAEKAKADGDAATTAARQQWLEANAAKLPAAYQAMIPASGDEAALKAGLEKARAAFKADIESGRYGIKAADVGAAGPSRPGAEGVDVDKLSPVQGLAHAYRAEQTGT